MAEPNESRAFEFVAQAAHDLRNRIAVVVAASSLLQRSWDRLTEALRREQVDVIAEHAMRLRELTDAVLDWASIETGHVRIVLEPVAVPEAVEAAVRDVARGRPVERRVDDGFVLADRGQFGRILSNLIGNALQYGEPPVRVCAATDDAEVIVRVEDFGTGVAPEIADRVFEPFVRHARSSEQGTGLGLAIVRALAELQGGRVWYERDERVSSFVVALPAAR